MTSAGQRNRFVCHVLVGDQNGHIGLGSKCAKEVATAIRGGIIAAKLQLIPVRRGYWGALLGFPHTVPLKVHGKCGSVRVRLSLLLVVPTSLALLFVRRFWHLLVSVTAFPPRAVTPRQKAILCRHVSRLCATHTAI